MSFPTTQTHNMNTFQPSQIVYPFYQLGKAMKKITGIMLTKIIVEFLVIALIYGGFMFYYSWDEVTAYIFFGFAGFFGLIYIGITIAFIFAYVHYFEALVDISHAMPNPTLKKAINFQIVGLILIQTPASIIGTLCDIIGFYYLQQWIEDLIRPTLHTEQRMILQSKVKMLYYAHIGQLFGLGILIPIVFFKAGQAILDICTVDFFQISRNPLISPELICDDCERIFNTTPNTSNFPPEMDSDPDPDNIGDGSTPNSTNLPPEGL